MIIITDSREQHPLDFDHPYIAQIRRAKLNVGDYAVEFSDMYQPLVAIERKSVSDLFGTLSTGYKRFKKEIIRAKDNKILLIIAIEGSVSKVLKGCEPCQRSGDEIFQQLMTLNIRYGIPFYCFNNREEMSRWIIELFLSIGREHVSNKKDNNE